MKICIIGAGSSYAPELFEKLAEVKKRLPISHITLMDTDPKRDDQLHQPHRHHLPSPP